MSGRWQTLSDSILNWRDRLLTSPAFQSRSLRLPVARWIARRRMRALFDLCGGFVYSQVLLACVRLGLLEMLAQSPRSAAELAPALKLPRASLDRLLEAAESLQLIQARGRQRFGIGPLGAALIGNPSVAMMIEHHSAFYADLTDPVALLRGQHEATGLGQFWAYAQSADASRVNADNTAGYSELMAASQQLIAEQVLSSYSIHDHHRLLDVGGGNGTFALAAMRKQAQLQACVFDLPPVAERARQRFEQLGLDQRACAMGGDFRADPLPADHDLVALVRVLHDHDDEAALRLLRAVRQAIKPTGVLLIAEPMLGTRGAEPVTAAYFGFYLMAMGQGRPRSTSAIRSMLREAGFGPVREHRTAAPLLVRVLSARPLNPARPS